MVSDDYLPPLRWLCMLPFHDQMFPVNVSIDSFDRNTNRNPELFHGFVLNGPLIVPGFQVFCAQAEFDGTMMMMNDELLI